MTLRSIKNANYLMSHDMMRSKKNRHHVLQLRLVGQVDTPRAMLRLIRLLLKLSPQPGIHRTEVHGKHLVIYTKISKSSELNGVMKRIDEIMNCVVELVLKEFSGTTSPSKTKPRVSDLSGLRKQLNQFGYGNNNKTVTPSRQPAYTS